MDDEFEAMFGDELDAMRDMEYDPGENDTKSKKSLKFDTPRAKKNSLEAKQANLDDSFPTPLKSPQFGNTESQNLTENATEKTKPKKRSQDEMFADMPDDDEIEDNEENRLPDIAPKRKRSRTNKEISKVLMNEEEFNEDDFQITPPASPFKDVVSEKIQCLRKQAAPKVYKSNTVISGDDFDYERVRVHKRIPKGGFTSVTTSDGKRAYMSMKSEDQLDIEASSFPSAQTTLELLGTPLAVLKAQIEEEKRKRVIDESKRLAEMVSINIEDVDGDEVASTKENKKVEGLNTEIKHDLWVERYSPRRYTELMSDESTNRTLLKWLKLWDHVVFGREKKDVKLTKKQQKFDQKQKIQKFGKNPLELPEELDQFNRPMHKVALLSGPPGLGKTTLAHVIAKHAGYNVVEMNASDDRSVDIFKTKIEAATQMKAVLGADPKPNCLIIDEIDGSPQAAINVLLSVIKWTDQKESGKRKKRDGSLLLRPIICICNDLYVPALRLLRQCALVISFPQTLSSKLAGRLLEVSKAEKLKTDLTTLIALCEKADNDIRSCLNTLQFVRSKYRELSMHSVHSMSLGQKDSHKNLFSVWKGIFQMPKPKRKRYVNPYDRATLGEVEDLSVVISQNNMSSQARFFNTLDLAQAAGEHEKVMQGLFENYLEAKVKDPRMEAVLEGTEWICFSDMVNKRIAQSQNYSFLKFTPYLPVAFHLLFAANNPQKIQYPHSQYEESQKLNKTNQLVSTMMNHMAPSVRKNLNIMVIVTETLPPLMEIIQPTLRPVNTQLYSAREKIDMAQLIKIMIAYNLSYHQERNQDGQYNYNLEPNMEEVNRFPGLKSQRQLTYGAKQLISREIELEKMRRSEGALGGTDRFSAKKPKPYVKESKDKDKKEEEHLPNYKRQTLQPKDIVVKEKPVLDFFGRRLTQKQVETNEKKENDREIIGGDIWFKFKEGYTNAVRKIVRMQDLQ